MQTVPWWQIIGMAVSLIGLLVVIAMNLRLITRDRKIEVDKLVEGLSSRFGKSFDEATGKFHKLTDQFAVTATALTRLTAIVDVAVKDVERLNIAAGQVLKMEARLEILFKDFDAVRTSLRSLAQDEDVMAEMEKITERINQLEKQLHDVRDRVSHHSGTMTAALLPRTNKPR